MKALIKAIAAAGAVIGAGPAAAQDAAARLDALTCSAFLGLGAEDQRNVMLALRAHVNGDPLPDTPLPVGLGDEAVRGGPEDAGGAAEGTGGEGSEGTDPPDETGVVDAEDESGNVNPDGTEASVTEGSRDPKLTAMRTSCEGGPESLASDALRAAHADYE